MSERRGKTFALLIAGLLFIGMGYALATVVVDGADPIRVSSTPTNGGTYMPSTLTAAAIHLTDLSGVAYTTYDGDTGDATAPMLLSPVSGSPPYTDNTWSGSISPAADGVWRNFEFAYGDNSNPQNPGTYFGVYQVYSQLDGTWSIRPYQGTWQTITPSSVITTGETQADFRFVKSVGVDDGQITCTFDIVSGGTGSMTLTNVAAGTWEGTWDFGSDGTYVVDLVANDGIGSPVVASILDIGGGDGPRVPEFDASLLFYMAGAVCLAWALKERR